MEALREALFLPWPLIRPLRPRSMPEPVGGIFKSTNGGSSWSFLNSGFPSEEFTSMVIDPSAPSTLYAGTSRGLIKSTDGGDSWSVLFGLYKGPQDVNVEALAI